METQLHQSVLLPSLSNAFQITRMTGGVLGRAKVWKEDKFNSFLSMTGASHLSKTDYVCESVYLYAVRRRVQVYISNKVSVLFQLGV